MGLVLLVAVLTAAVSFAAAAVFISDEALQTSHHYTASTGRRSLLQAREAASAPTADCPVNLAAADYKVLTSRCPPMSQCCAAFKDLACPYAAYLNDNTTDCALTMFGYIHLQGYPPGLFADNCSDGPNGVRCPDHTPPPPTSAAAGLYPALTLPP